MSKNSGGFGKFLFGAVVGASLALLFAPQSGKETRKMLKIKLDNLGKKLKEVEPKDVLNKANSIINDIKDGIENLDKEKVQEIIKEKSLLIASRCDDLVQLAVEKGTPVFQRAANDIKSKTSIVLRDMADKMDNSELSKPTKKVSKNKSGN